VDGLAGAGVRALSVAPDTVRLVTHHDLPADGIDRAEAALRRGLPKP
jgi:hypothetical protein